MPQFGRDLIWATTALLLYGVIGQLFVRETPLVPSNIINSALFLQWFGIPVQLFRGLAAVMLLVFMVRALKAFDVETRRRLDAANQARLNALNQVVDAQEVERKRIARELHDATGQSLTAIALGLRGVEMHIENSDTPPIGLLDKVREIKTYSTNALGELHQIIADLRPQILDDMGLAAALKWYVHKLSAAALTAQRTDRRGRTLSPASRVRDRPVSHHTGGVDQHRQACPRHARRRDAELFAG